jgi:ABC-type ATPase involved in cell division
MATHDNEVVEKIDARVINIVEGKIAGDSGAKAKKES